MKTASDICEENEWNPDIIGELQKELDLVIAHGKDILTF